MNQRRRKILRLYEIAHLDRIPPFLLCPKQTVKKETQNIASIRNRPPGPDTPFFIVSKTNC
jgi:hypothetical protein